METDTRAPKATGGQRLRVHFVKFSLRTVLILVTASAACLSWVLIPAQRQKTARLWVESQRGWYTFETPYRPEDGWYESPSGLPIPKFAIDWFGIDTFANVTFVGFDADEVYDLKPLAGFPRLEELYINQFVHPQVEFSALQPLSHLRTLKLTKWSGVGRDELEAISLALAKVEIFAESHPDFASVPGE